MAKVISVTIQKGGVAKTTTAATLIAGLQARGYKVLGIDLDPQSNLTEYFRAKPIVDICDVLDGKESIRKAVVATSFGAAFLPCSRSLFAMEFRQSSNDLLQKALVPIMDYFDYIIIDTPPALSSITINALMASQWVVIPAILGDFCRQAIPDVGNTIITVRKNGNPDLNIAGILVTMKRPRSKLQDVLTDEFGKIADAYGTKIFNTPIRDAQAVKDAQAFHQTIFEYAPKSNVALDYNAFIDELLEVVK